MISLVDLKKLENTLEKLSEESFYKVDLSWHIDRWAKSKQHMFLLFGNKLKVEQEVDAILPESAVTEMLRVFIYENNIDSKVEFLLINYLLESIKTSDVITNCLSGDIELFGTTFKKGMKISRIFAKLVSKELCHDIQTKYSMFIQKLKSKGKAVISIDPIDYITMSENKNGWRSCHALDGEYRAGTLAYMVDTPTAISYVKTSEDITRSDDTLPYANKIWRQIVLVDKDTTFSIQARQYPGTVIANAETVSSMLKELFQTIKGESYRVTKTEVSVLERFVDNYDCVDERLWYNDITSGAFESGNVVHVADQSVSSVCSNSSYVTVGSNVRCVEDNDLWLRNSAYLSRSNADDNYEDDYDDYENEDQDDNY